MFVKAKNISLDGVEKPKNNNLYTMLLSDRTLLKQNKLLKILRLSSTDFGLATNKEAKW
ncbi:MAG: hypothetical protein AAFQ14_06175 [Cyanobacteria bacterium J06621_12]